MDKMPVMVITGSSRGIGRGMAKQFVEQGYRVVGCSRGPSTLDIDGYYHSQVDVGNEEQISVWVRSIKRTFGRIDVLVSNAAYAPAASQFALTSGKMLESVLRTNALGSYYVCREIVKVMISQNAGRIITVSSMAAGLHQKGTSAYSMSKSAVVEMTKILAKEVVHAGITCNVIAPSVFITDAVKKLGEEVIGHAFDTLTIKRELTIQEICNVVSFFAAPESGCITGQVIHLGLVT